MIVRAKKARRTVTVRKISWMPGNAQRPRAGQRKLRGEGYGDLAESGSGLSMNMKPAMIHAKITIIDGIWERGWLH